MSLKSAKLRVLKLFKNNIEPKKVRLWYSDRVQRKSVLQPPIRGSCSLHVLAPIPFFISRIDYNPSVIWISPKNSTLRTKITSPIAKSTSPGLVKTQLLTKPGSDQMRLYHKHPPPFSNVHSSLTLKLLKFQSLSTTVQFRTTIDCAKWLLSLSFVNVTHVYFYIHRLVTPKSTWPRMGATGQFLIFWVTCGVNCWNVKKEFLQCQRQFCLRSKIGQMVS